MNLKFYAKSSLLLLFISFLFCENATAQAWDLAQDKNGVKVSTRKIDGYKLKEFKGETIIKTTSHKVLALLKNIEGYVDWMPDCKESKVLKKISDTEFYQYTVTDAPWPVTDRDNVAHMKINEKENGTIHIVLKGTPDYIAKNSAYVRVPQLQASWKIIPQNNGNTKVVYQGLASAGGSIPDWLANSFVVDTPYETLVKMNKKIAK
ncbi:MAG: START domain-containing protein [Chitinophagales bacterium]